MQVDHNPSLSRLSSIGLGGRALAKAVLKEEKHWEELAKLLEKEGGTPLVLGQGSNVLFADGQLPYFLLQPEFGPGFKVVAETDKTVRVQVGSGERLQRFLSRLQRMGLSGLEGLVGIPGRLGGAAAMNAGSFGAEMADVLTRVLVWDFESGIHWKKKEDLGFAYRKSSLSGTNPLSCALVLDLELYKENPEKVLKKMRSFFKRKKFTQPIWTKTCGCVFKNSVSAPAGYLLEKCGFKGRGSKDVYFSSMHANFLINAGNGTSSQAMELIAEGRKRVKEKFGVKLELEVKVFG